MDNNKATINGSEIYNLDYIGALNLVFIKNGTFYPNKYTVTINATLNDDMGTVTGQNISFVINNAENTIFTGNAVILEGKSSISYTFNNGNLKEDNITVVVYLPDNFVPTNNGAIYNKDLNTLTWTIDSLGSKSAKTFIFDGKFTKKVTILLI